MTDKILERFEKVLIQVQKFDALFERENDLEVLRMACFEFAGFTYLKKGNLFILAQLVEEYRKTKVDYIEQNIFLQESLDLISKYQFKEIKNASFPIFEKREQKRKNNNHLQDLFYQVKQEKYFNLRKLKFDTKFQIKAKYTHLKKQVFLYLNLMFFFNREFKNREEPINLDELSRDKINFYDSWNFSRASLQKWIKYPDTDFLDLPVYQNKLMAEKIHKIQQRLFQKALQAELQELLIKLAKGNRILNYKRFLDLTENFINGNFQTIDLKRLTTFFSFDRPDEVLVELDNILMEKEIDFKKYLPYDRPNKTKSPRFTAELLVQFGINCTKTLKFYANKGSIKDLNDAKFNFSKKFIPKHKVCSFQFIQSSINLMKLKSVLKELNTKFNLIALNDQVFNEFLEVLTCQDYTKLNFKIHIACKTNLFSYVLKELKPFFSNLTGKEIEESKIFLTKLNNKPLTASNFNKSGNSNIVEKDEIRRIINRK